jgi:hypothetical protein
MEESNSVLFEKLVRLFGITDMTTDRVPRPQDGIVFTTNIFIPMEGRVYPKTFMYLSGFVKMVETFQARIRKCLRTEKQAYLYVYYDSMFYEKYNDEKYELNNTQNDNLNKEIKGNYATNNDVLKKLLSDYRKYLEKIKNENDKYSFIKLFSFNCPHLDKKSKGYLGHNDTFGSIVRLITLFDPRIPTAFSINGRNPLTPRLCFLIRKWLESGRVVLTQNDFSYDYYPYNKVFFNEILLQLKDDVPGYQDFISKFADSMPQNELLKTLQYSRICKYRPLAGVVGINRCNEITQKRILYWFYKTMRDLLFLQSKHINDPSTKRPHEVGFEKSNSKRPFEFGVDELLLGILFNEMNIDGGDKTISEESRRINEDLVYPYQHTPADAHVFQAYKERSFFKPSYNLFTGDEIKRFTMALKTSEDYVSIPQYLVGRNIFEFENLSLNMNLTPMLLNLEDQEAYDKVITKIMLLSQKICLILNEQNNKLQPHKYNENEMKIICNSIYNFTRAHSLINIFENNQDTLFISLKFEFQSKNKRLCKNKDQLNPLGFEFLSRLGILNLFERYKLIKQGDEISRQIFREIGEEKYVEDFLSNPDGKYSLLTLFFCFDELKPLRIYQKEEDLKPDILPFSEYNTKIFIGDPDLVDKMVEHYSNPEKTLHVPYEMKELPTAAGGSSQAGGFKKNLKLTKKYKKTNKKRKSRHNKKSSH